jgi:hypothetical protein
MAGKRLYRLGIDRTQRGAIGGKRSLQGSSQTARENSPDTGRDTAYWLNRLDRGHSNNE